MINAAAIRIRIASMTPEIFSTFPCPYGCPESGGVSETLTAKKAITAASRSIEECIASEIILTEPLIIPTISFIAISRVFDKTESLAILVFAFINDGKCLEGLI
jgi:hypothetical protein